MNRRDILKLAAVSAAHACLPLASKALDDGYSGPILDAHIHLFDPTRAGGIVWPTPADTVLYKPALPERYAKMSAPYGIVGAVAIEASPLATDNDWLLKVAQQNPVMVGVIGNLVPGAPAYLRDLERLHRNPLFFGFRYGNLWKRDLMEDLGKPGFVDGLKALAQAGLVLESANPDPKLMRALLEIAQRVPELRVVVDHLPNAAVPKDASGQKEFSANVAELATHTEVFVKLSEIPRLENGKLVTEMSAYKDALDRIWGEFGEDRIFFGSDWPNSDTTASFDETLGIVRSYISTKSREAAAKYYWDNSKAVYRWKLRRSNQKR